MHAIIFRFGWETNSIDTIFSYLFTLLSNDMICVKTLSHWLFKQLNEIYGGTPPRLDELFVHIIHTTHKTKFKRILAASVLIFHGSFLEIIGNEPSGKYNDLTHHHFHHITISVIADTKISIDTINNGNMKSLQVLKKNIGWRLKL